MLTDPDSAKRALRALLHPVRGPDETESGALVTHLLAIPLSPGLPIGGVAPLPREPDLTPAWDALHARGHPVLLAETTSPGQPLRFRTWHPDAVLVAGRHGTRHPEGAPATPQLLFVPLLAWDRRMRRLGHGGGYFDRTLAALRDAIAIGVGLSRQEVAAVPTGPHDVPLDAVLTERGLVLPEGGSVADLVPGRHRRT